MLIQYRTTGHQRNVADGVGERLCRSKIADRVDDDSSAPVGSHEELRRGQTYLTRDMRADVGQEISPITGRQKRPYRRRDQKAEE